MLFFNTFYLFCSTVYSNQLKKLILGILVLSILVGGYAFYSYYSKEENKDVWNFVPENSLAVYEIQDVVSTYSQIENTGIGKALGKLQVLNEIQDVLLPSDSSVTDLDILQKLRNVQVLISFHEVAKERLDMAYYVNISHGEASESIQEYINEVIKQTKSSLTKRVYNDRLIFEIDSEEFNISYFMEDGVLAISKTPFLIEDIIRAISTKKEQGFKDVHHKSLKANKLKNDQGDLYVNTAKLGSLFGVFGKELTISELAHSTFLDVKVTDNLLSLSGFTYVQNEGLLNSMKDQKSVEISINNYIPNSTYSLFHTGVSNASSWYNNYRKEIRLNDANELWNIQRMIGWLGEEIALVNVNTRNDNAEGKLLFLGTKDLNDALNQINTLSEEVLIELQDTLYFENYGGVVIKELNVSEFPEMIFGKTYRGFPVSYYAVFGKYLVLTNDIESMHLLINSIDQESTWGRTLAKSQWLSNTLEEASISYFFDYSQAIDLLRWELNDTWKQQLETNIQVMKGLGMGAIQFSNIDGLFYTSMMFQYDSEKSKISPLNFDIEYTTYLQSAAITKPFVVRNHNTTSFREVFVQDSLLNIYLMDHNGAVVWQDSIGQSIDGQVYQIDYYENRKLQYLFAAGQLIYLIDRNGDMVEGYPIEVGFEINKLSVFDYDLTKDYRILVSDDNANLVMYSKEGTKLEGWQPSHDLGQLQTSPRHIRVRGKDAIVAIYSNGNVGVMNRRGEMFKGFPIDLKNEISGDVHIGVGRDFEHTVLSAISKDGELVQFDLNGNIVNKRQLYKPTKDTSFELVEGVTKRDFVIMRQNIFRLSLLDTKENTIMEKDYLNSALRNLQYYDLGGDDNIYVVNDFTQGFGYIYNHEGKLLNNVPINNSQEIGLLQNAQMGKTLIYSVYQNQVSIYSF